MDARSAMVRQDARHLCHLRRGNIQPGDEEGLQNVKHNLCLPTIDGVAIGGLSIGEKWERAGEEGRSKTGVLMDVM